jgi:hypothetical protein
VFAKSASPKFLARGVSVESAKTYLLSIFYRNSRDSHIGCQ